MPINDANYALHNIDNFKKSLDYSSSEILAKYIDLVTEYLNYFFENNKIKNTNSLKFIVVRGLETISHVFNTILYYTKNIDITYLHCQKAYYFYIEFIGQILEDNNVFLQLSSKDATMYVYKKTIFEINSEYKQNIIEPGKDELAKIDYITEHIFLFKSIVSKMLNDNSFINSINKNIVIGKFNNIGNKIIQTKVDIQNIAILHIFFDSLIEKNNDFIKFYEILNVFFKKINKKTNINLSQIKNKLIHEDFSNILADETNEKFIAWVFAV